MRKALDSRDGEMHKFGEVATDKCVSLGNRDKEVRQALDGRAEKCVSSRNRDGEMCKFGEVATEKSFRQARRRNA